MGSFDGVHLGHRHLLDQVVERARALGVPACVYTFEPSPRVFAPGRDPRSRLMSWPDKLHFLGRVGIDQVIIEQFTPAFSMHPAEWFIDQILRQRIQPSEMVVGYDFRFGRGRAGTVEMLRGRLQQHPIRQVEGVQDHDKVISSSRIRGLLEAGQVDAASRLLGRSHFVRGTVVAGEQRGRTIGFPTANVMGNGEMLPEAGVYVVHTAIDRGPVFAGVANLGQRPTFAGRGLLLEVHLLDFDRDIYGCEVEVRFLQRLRGEICFDSADALVAQIERDEARARAVLASR